MDLARLNSTTLAASAEDALRLCNPGACLERLALKGGEEQFIAMKESLQNDVTINFGFARYAEYYALLIDSKQF